MSQASGRSDAHEAGHYDVVICGGGNAGLLLARQLQQPERSILVLDRAGVPSPSACHKVGESLTEGGSYHLRHVLGLGDHLFDKHVPKLGLRFFFGGGHMPLVDRLEYGSAQWPPFATFQLDRGLLENDLRDLVAGGGATVIPQCSVSTIELAEDEGPHRILAEHEGRMLAFTARFVVDATGRRRLLASKLGLARPVEHRASACWWRVDGRVDISRLVGPEHRDWHDRVAQPRWYSTVHLAGEGYWVWLIPLANGRTSIGIVSDEDRHPVRERSSWEDALEWCRAHEPGLAGLVEGLPPLDFLALKRFAHSTTRAFSHRRWCCIGEAAVFSDPLYSLGQDLIAHAVTITAKLIDLDRKGQLTEGIANRYNDTFLKLFQIIIEQYQDAYPTFGSPFLYTHKLAWDSAMYFAILQQTMTQNVHDDPGGLDAMDRTLDRLAPLNRAMQRLFRDAFRIDGRLDVYEGMRTWAPRITQYADAALDKCLAGGLDAFFDARMDRLEGIATELFGSIIRHSPSIPAEQADRVLKARVGIDPRAVSMHPEKWEADALFDPARPALDFDMPSQWDINFRIRAELDGFRPIQSQFRAAVAEDPERIAIVKGDEALSLGEVSERVAAVAAVAAGSPSQFVGVQASSAPDGLMAMLGIFMAGKTFVLFDRDWDAARRRLVERSCEMVTTITDATMSTSRATAGGFVPETGLDPMADRQRIAFRKVRFSDQGTSAIDLDHAAYFRMLDWLAKLARNGLPAPPAGQTPSCLWLGPATAEMIVTLLLGWRIFAADGDADPSGLIGKNGIGTLFGTPRALQAFVDAGRPVNGLRIISVGDALTRELGLHLLSRAAKVVDFGFATFAH